ncbi:MAG TPA: hypothetical protein VLN56_01840 [Gammaproteobacteria bacterium]|nr:hypothetical protein [Gammaproteobacteria bacterium]
MIPACILFIASILFTTNVDARMYQWTDEDTGTTQLSGKPPAWYRSDQGGPRVFVFEKNRIIDDTAIEVSDGERERLRQEAFLKAEEDRAAAREKAMAAEELKSSLKKDRLLQEETAAMVGEEPEEIMPEEEAAETEMVEMPADDQTLEEMRELIHEWEEQQAREARQKLEMQQEANPVY